MRLVIAFGLAVVLAGCIAKRDMDECRKGDRSRCPGDARNKTMLAALPQPTPARADGRLARHLLLWLDPGGIIPMGR